MKAEQYGTHAEQTRFSQGWKSAKQRPVCGNCRYLEEKVHNPDSLCESFTYRCALGSFATAKTAICERHKGGEQ